MCWPRVTLRDIAEVALELRAEQVGADPNSSRRQLYGELLEFLEARTELAVLAKADEDDQAQLVMGGVA